MTENNRVRLLRPEEFPGIGNIAGTIQPEPTETPGVLCVMWDGRERVTWHKTTGIIRFRA